MLRVLKRKTLSKLRKAIEPVSPAAFARFLGTWQHVLAVGETSTGAQGTLRRALGQLEGAPIPASVLEREVLPARVPGYQPWMLDQLLASGEGRLGRHRADRLARWPRRALLCRP